MGNTKVNQQIFKVPVGIFEFLETLRKPLQGKRHHHYLVEGTNKKDAKLLLTKEPSFWRNYNQLPIEKRKKLQPFTLLRKGKIEEILACEKRYKNKRGDYTCGKPIYSIENHEDKNDKMVNMNGEFGMCCIEGYDTFDSPDCPYNTN